METGKAGLKELMDEYLSTRLLDVATVPTDLLLREQELFQELGQRMTRKQLDEWYKEYVFKIRPT